MGFDLNAYGQYDPANPLGAVTGMPVAPKKRGWQSLLYDHMNHSDPNDPYPMQDADKSHAIRQGLLQFAANVSQPNGGNFAAALSKGLLAGSGSVNDSQGEFANDQYRKSIMQRTMASEAANTAKTKAWQHLYGADGSVDPAGEHSLQQADPEGYLTNKDKIHPQSKWELKDVNYNGAQGTVYYDPTTNQMRTLDGQPFNGGGMPPQGAQAGPQGAPSPMGGSGSQMPTDALHGAQMRAESGGNDNAMSHKGAFGRMQIMPATAANPGFGMQPLDLANATPQQNEAFGSQYMGKVTAAAGGDPRMGLAAYNWGIGKVHKALSQPGATPESVLAHAPSETQNYVKKIMANSGMGGVNSLPPDQTATVVTRPSLPFGFAQKEKAGGKSKYEQNKEFVSQWEADNPGKTFPNRGNFLMTGKAAGEDGEAVLPAGTENLRGEELLKALPQQDANMVRALNAGTKAWPTASAMKDPDWKRWTAETQQYDSASDEGSFKNRVNTRKQFTTGTQGQQINALNTTANHLLEASHAIDALHNSSLPAWNYLANKASAASGKDPVTNFAAVITPIASEMEKVYRGNGGTESGVNAWRDALSPNASPEQQHGVLKEWVQLIKGKIDAQQQQYDQGMGPMGTPLRMVNPNAQKAYDALSNVVQKLGDDPASYGLTPTAKPKGNSGWGIQKVGH